MTVDVGGARISAAIPAAVVAPEAGARAGLRWEADAVHPPQQSDDRGARVAARGGAVLWRRRVSDRLYGKPCLLLLLLLAPPMLWFGVIHLGSLFALLANAFFQLDDYSGRVVRELILKNLVALPEPANLDVALRTTTMAVLVTLACIVLGFPGRLLHGASCARRTQGAVLHRGDAAAVEQLPRAAVRVKAAAGQGRSDLPPIVGGNSLSFSPLGTFIVFVYMWLPLMILPVSAAIERIPRSLPEASSDLGAAPGQTFRDVILPLAWPGVAAGAIFTYSLTLGDYIIPQVIGDSTMFYRPGVSVQQGVAGNIPVAAAFSLVPIALVAAYLGSRSARGPSMRFEAPRLDRPAHPGLGGSPSCTCRSR